jgi:hypothetical protein
MILELAEHVEAATRDPLSENRTTRFNQRPPGDPVFAARVNVEPIGNNGISPGAQYNSQAFTERREARGVMH